MIRGGALNLKRSKRREEDQIQPLSFSFPFDLLSQGFFKVSKKLGCACYPEIDPSISVFRS
jgi:hypothetical protein